MYRSPAIDQRVRNLVLKARIRAIVCGFSAALFIKNMWEMQDPSFWDAGIVGLEAWFAYTFYNSHKNPLNDLINEVTNRLNNLPHNDDTQAERNYLNIVIGSLEHIDWGYNRDLLLSGFATLTGNFLYNKISSTFFNTSTNDETTPSHDKYTAPVPS